MRKAIARAPNRSDARAYPERECLPESLRPLQELMKHLVHLNLDAQGNPDFKRASPSLLLAIAENAEEAAACINRGLSAIGSLWACSAPEIEDGTIGYDTVEALGWLVAELGAVTSECLGLSARCRQADAKRYAKLRGQAKPDRG